MPSRNITPSQPFNILLAFLLCASWSTVNGQYGASSSRGVTGGRNRFSDPGVPQELTQEALNEAAKYSMKQGSLLYSRLDDDLEKNGNAYHTETRTDPSYRSGSRTSQEQGVSRDDEQEEDSVEAEDFQGLHNFRDASSLSSRSARRTLKSASESAQGLWSLVNPSDVNLHRADHKAREENTQIGENDPVSADEALQHMRGVIHILSQTHNALLDKKLATAPFLQRLWLKFFYSYGDPRAGHYGKEQKDPACHTLSNLAHSARDFANVFGNSAVKENINSITETFAREMILSISALKEAARNSAHGGWLMTPDTKAHVGEMKENLSVLSENWLQRIGVLAGAAKPVAANIASNEYIQEKLKDVEAMVTDFQEEIWRTRTEWVYQQTEALSWATESFQALRELGLHEFDRLSDSVHARVFGVKHILKDRLERNRAHVAYLQQHAAERVNHFIDLLVLWIDVNKGLLRTVTSMSKSYLDKSWRIISFVAVIVIFRFMLSFVHADTSVRYLVSSAFTRTNGTNSVPHGERPPSERRPQMPLSISSPQSESSESNQVMKESVCETNVAHNTSKSSQVRETALPNHENIVNSVAQRRARRTPSKYGKLKMTREARPLQPSNLSYHAPVTSSGLHRDGQPISIGDHEVQLVYDNAPGSVRIEGSRNESGRKRTPKTAGRQRSPGLEDMQRARERQVQSEDDDNISEPTSGFESATSRQTRSSARRTSARRRHLR